MTSRPADPEEGDQLHAFMLELGRALSLSGTAVSETQERLTRIAAANGEPDARVIVLPTALMIGFGRAGWATLESIPQVTSPLRLDQISVLYELVKRAQDGRVTPSEGLIAMRAIRSMKPRYGPFLTVLAHTVMTIGLCLILQPTLLDIALTAVFGAFVGILVLLARGHQTLSVLNPIIAAATVSALTFVLVKHGIGDPGLRTLIAPLVTFLPGSALTTATVELASGEMIAGSSRLVFGGLQMLLLAFGIVAGVEIAGLPSEQVLHDFHVNLLGLWAPWLGVLLFGIACAVYFSAPRGALRWLLLVLFVAWIGQLAGDWLVDAKVSGFFGALLMTPVALAISRVPGGPPSQVTFLPAFWMLVPGAIGLIGVTEFVGNPATAGLENLVQPVAAIVAIALGVLCGVAVFRGLVSAPHRLHLKRGQASGPGSRSVDTTLS